jgi:hypothetical protein
MSFRFLQRVCHATVAATAIALLSPLLRADELPAGKPVKYSDPADKTEASEASSGQSQNELLEKLRAANPSRKSSLDGLPAPSVVPPVQSVVPDSKTQEMLDRRKDWIFSTPEQLILGRDRNSATEVESSRTDEGNKQKLTPMEEFYLNLVRPSSKPGRGDKDLKDKEKEDSRTPAGLRDREDQLKQLILSESPGNVSSLSGVRAGEFDYMGVRNAERTEENLLQKARTEERRQLFGLPSPQASWKELLSLTPKTSEATPLSSGLSQSDTGVPGSLKTTESSSMFTPQSQVGMIPSAPQLADVNARVLNPAILSAGSMKVDLKPVQASSTPPTPTFSAPRRTF